MSGSASMGAMQTWQLGSVNKLGRRNFTGKSGSFHQFEARSEGCGSEME